jgi:hypothetical protein
LRYQALTGSRIRSPLAGTSLGTSGVARCDCAPGCGALMQTMGGVHRNFPSSFLKSLSVTIGNVDALGYSQSVSTLISFKFSKAILFGIFQRVTNELERV